jgi:hypothetical protein
MKESVKASATKSTDEFHAKEQQRRIPRKESDKMEVTDAKKGKGAFALRLRLKLSVTCKIENTTHVPA